MLRLRLEVQPFANVNAVCAQSTRIATLLGIEVVFEFSCKDYIAKPGMNADNLIHECMTELKAEEQPAPETPAAIPVTGNDDSNPKKGKSGSKGGKQKDPIPEATQPDVQQESI